MSVPFSRVMNALVSKSAPELIYSYKPGAFIKVGSVALSLVFVTYGVTFADWSYESSITVYKNADEKTKKDWKFLVKTFSPIGLTVIPFALAVGAIYAQSRIVTKVTYVPKLNGKPECQLQRRSAILGRPIETTRPISQINRNEKKRVFTGEGDQGVEDRGSFIFFLTDTSPSVKRWIDRYYILSRSGTFWASDGRVFDALFSGDSIRDLELKTRSLKNGNDKSPSKPLQDINQDRSILEEMIKKNSRRAKFHPGKKEVDLSKRIVNQNNKATTKMLHTHKNPKILNK